MSKVLVLGGYGNFGKLISKRLSSNKDIKLFIAGRSLESGKQFLKTLNNSNTKSLVLDINKENQLSNLLSELKPEVVINTCGPYDDFNYKVAKICLQHDSNYIDLADSMEFVVGIEKLQVEAKLKNKVVISGASSVPGLSSSVVHHFEHEFDEIESIDAIISPGNKQMFRGVATVSSVLSYCGSPFETLKNGEKKTIFGWQGLKMVNIPGIPNTRLVSDCKVPDLVLFPRNYPSLKNFSFKAGIELKFFQFGVYVLSVLKRMGILKNVSNYSSILDKISRLFTNFGTDEGGMNVNLHGKKEGEPHVLNWSIVALSGDGPEIPSTPAAVLTEKILRNEIPSNAYPCWQLFTLHEFMESIKDFDIYTVVNNGKSAYSIIDVIGKNNYDKFPKDIQSFHSIGGECKGYLKVTRGSNFLARLVASIAGFPKENPNAFVKVVNEKGIWTRDFNGHILKSKWINEAHHGLVIEDFGLGAKFAFQLVPLKDNSGFKHISKKMWMLGFIQIPNFLRVSADGLTKGLENGGWSILVEIKMPILGLLVKYEGNLYLNNNDSKK
jgi:saccharopine dehydrogenase-like NADP-dependent oxidoreductase